MTNRGTIDALAREYLGQKEDHSNDAPDMLIRSWPIPPAKEAYHGLIGEMVDAVAPHSEADPVAILTHMLVMFGNLVGRQPYVQVEADRHHVNENALNIGGTSKGRKGTAQGQARRMLEAVDSDWASKNIKQGLSSGEGLIHAVRDEVMRKEPVKENGRATGQQAVIVDEGVSDKRLLVIESEFASTLRVMARDGNTLSATIRQAWDSGALRTLTKITPEQATDAHISIIGHVTADELRRRLDGTEVANGFLNRFLLVCVRRSQCLPEGGTLRDKDLDPLKIALRGVVATAKDTGELTRDPAARALWADVYPELSEGQPGLIGAATSRAEAHVVRLSALYALLDQSQVIHREHLEAGLALWAYCDASARFVFGDALADPVADKLYGLLVSRSEGVTRTEMYNHFDRHTPAKEIARALGLLASQGRAERLEPEPTGGRPIERWAARKARKARNDDGGVPTALNARPLGEPGGPGLERDIPFPDRGGAYEPEEVV